MRAEAKGRAQGRTVLIERTVVFFLSYARVWYGGFHSLALLSVTLLGTSCSPHGRATHVDHMPGAGTRVFLSLLICCQNPELSHRDQVALRKLDKAGAGMVVPLGTHPSY